MKERQKPVAIAELYATLAASEPDGRWLIVGDGTAPEKSAWETALESIDQRIVRANDPAGIAGVAGEEMFSLAVVFPRAVAGGATAVLRRLLASVRDRYARRVLIPDHNSTLTLTDYLALGFERLPGKGLESVYLFDPDAESRQREWNNARDWANPENFDLYRW